MPNDLFACLFDFCYSLYCGWNADGENFAISVSEPARCLGQGTLLRSGRRESGERVQCGSSLALAGLSILRGSNSSVRAVMTYNESP